LLEDPWLGYILHSLVGSPSFELRALSKGRISDPFGFPASFKTGGARLRGSPQPSKQAAQGCGVPRSLQNWRRKVAGFPAAFKTGGARLAEVYYHLRQDILYVVIPVSYLTTKAVFDCFRM